MQHAARPTPAVSADDNHPRIPGLGESADLVGDRPFVASVNRLAVDVRLRRNGGRLLESVLDALVLDLANLVEEFGVGVRADVGDRGRMLHGDDDEWGFKCPRQVDSFEVASAADGDPSVARTMGLEFMVGLLVSISESCAGLAAGESVRPSIGNR